MRIALSGLILATVACGGSGKSVKQPAGVRIQDAGLPYRIVQAKTGRSLSEDEFYAELRGTKAICVGESHTDPHHHWAQLTIVDKLTGEGRAFSFATGMEMFQRPFQGVLDDFAQGKISEELMLRRSDWKRRWSHDWNLYADIVRLTIERGGQVLALNVSMELKDKWKKSGTEGLSEAERAKIPELDLHDETHRRWFRSLMESMTAEGDHGGDHGGHALLGEPEDIAEDARHGQGEGDFIDQIYPVQVLWDETMADTAYKWLTEGDDRQLVILAGHGHCHDSAIVGRIRRRGVQEVVSVRPVVDTGQGEVADLLVAPENDYLFVMERLGQE